MPLQLHVHDVPYPGDCKQGAMPRVLLQGAVPGTLFQHQGATARYGTPVWCWEAWASRRKPGVVRQGAGRSRRSPKAWVCAELGAFSAARAARTQCLCPRSGARGGLPGHEPGPRAWRLGSALPGPPAQPAAQGTVEVGSGWDSGHRQSFPGAGMPNGSGDPYPRGCTEPSAGGGSTQRELSRL